jgi:hypothetical protein
MCKILTFFGFSYPPKKVAAIWQKKNKKFTLNLINEKNRYLKSHFSK